MAFVFINKIAVVVLIIGAMVYLYVKKKKIDSVLVLSSIVLFVWLSSVIVDGYFLIGLKNLRVAEIAVLPIFEHWGRIALYVLILLISLVQLWKIYDREIKKEDEEKQQDGEYENSDDEQ